jgi:site-specific DNA recombinase
MLDIKTPDRENEAGVSPTPVTVSIPFAPNTLPRKGVTHTPSTAETMIDATRTMPLTAIARSRNWIDSILNDPGLDFAAIAARENLSERYIRLLAPLAFVSPRVVEAIATGRAPGDMTVASLARNLPLAWPEQERRLGVL